MSGESTHEADFRKPAKLKKPKIKPKKTPTNTHRTSICLDGPPDPTCAGDLRVAGGGAGLGGDRKVATSKIDRDIVQRFAPEIFDVPPTNLQWTIILLCTETDSNMRRNNPFPRNCTVLDITIAHDFTSESGYQRVANILRSTCNVAVLVSFPCTGGCLLNAGINAKNPKCGPKLEAHFKLFKLLWRQYERLNSEFEGINTVFEWPRFCTYWM